MIDACRYLQLLSIACLGLYAGTMLTEGFVLVPWWQSLPPEDFFAWYGANDQRLLDFFRPITIAAAVVTVAAAALSWITGHPGRWAASAACAAMLAALATFFAYFEAANTAFSAASVAPEDLAAELVRWGRWHDSRIVLSLAALGCAVAARRRPD